MSYDPNEDRRPSELFHSYMRGWKHGTAFTGQAREFSENEDEGIREEYLRGYGDGYQDRKDRQKANAERLGYTPKVVRVCGD
jgi:hypothetical protein